MIDAEDSQMLSRGTAAADGEPDTDMGQLTKAIAAETGRKGKGLFMPLRLALSASGQARNSPVCCR